MATTIRMPQLGETVTEGTVAQWLKKPGDYVEKYEAFVEVSTDKVNAEVPSPVAGILRELVVAEGQTVPTGAPIAVIEEVGADGAGAPAEAPARPVTAAGPPARSGPTNGTSNAHHAPAETAAGVRVSPAVRRLAREHAVDIAGIAGTGLHGRVTAEDVLAAAKTPAAPAAAPPSVAPLTTAVLPTRPRAGAPADGTLVPLTQARRIIAQRMVESKHTAPHAWTMVEVDVTNLWRWRTREKDAFERAHGVKLTLLPFFMRAVVESLQAFPMLNASFRDDGIMVYPSIHLGIATAVDGNLLVPVIRNADRLSISGLANAAGELIERARRGKLGPDDLAGGTFTVNNTGANGSILSAPILVTGQAGIVTMEAVVKRPVVVDDDAIAIRSMMNVCLSIDHRVVDGAVASGFLSDLKRRLEALGPSGNL